MRILLISPKIRSDFYTPTDMGHHYGLEILAAITPPEHEIRLIDENVGQKINFNEPFDLVGISAFTAQAPRAYRIADEFKKRGVKVVLGGHHITVLPEEALLHCDAVCIGEAEDIWTQLLDDAADNRLKKTYQSGKLADLTKVPWPRRDLLPMGRFGAFNYIQTNRGCPFDCTFCSAVKFYHNTFRVRPVADIIAEIQHLIDNGKLKNRQVYFVDDNIIGSIRHAKELFRALIPLQIKWVAQCSLNIAKDDELLSLAAQSGCLALLIGFETVSRQSLELARKKTGFLDAYSALIKKIHEKRIQIIGSFLFGFDTDDKGIFDRVNCFANENHLEYLTYNILTPWPGTDMYDQYLQEGRLLHREWEYYDMYHAVYEPKLMTAKELQTGFRKAYRQIYSLRSIFRRVLGGARRAVLIPVLINLSFVFVNMFLPKKVHG